MLKFWAREKKCPVINPQTHVLNYRTVLKGVPMIGRPPQSVQVPTIVVVFWLGCAHFVKITDFAAVSKQQWRDGTLDMRYNIPTPM